jgi:hypothetical protein
MFGNLADSGRARLILESCRLFSVVSVKKVEDRMHRSFNELHHIPSGKLPSHKIEWLGPFNSLFYKALPKPGATLTSAVRPCKSISLQQFNKLTSTFTSGRGIKRLNWRTRGERKECRVLFPYIHNTQPSEETGEECPRGPRAEAWALATRPGRGG